MAPVPEPHPEVQQQRDNVVVLLGVSCIAACCMCWFLEHLAFLLRPLVFAVGLSLILRPFVDFVSDARYQKHKLRVWNARPPWFIARINELADFTDKIALRILGTNDFALASWHTLQDQAEITLKDESFWTSFANNLFNYLGDIAICMFYVVFLLAPPRTPARLQSTIVRRIHAAVKRFVMIMVALSAVRATLVGLLIWACGVPGSLSFTITVVSFWLFFIPNLGSFVAAAIPLPLLVLLPDLTTTQRWCGFFIPGLGSFLVGDILGPVWYRKGLDINEVVILLSLVFWFSVWGWVGAVLAVPIMCTLKIVMEGIPHAGAHAVARMMAPTYEYAYAEEDEGEWSDDEATPAVSVAGDGAEVDTGAGTRQRRRWRRPGWIESGYRKVLQSKWFNSMMGTETPARRRRRDANPDIDEEDTGRAPLLRRGDDSD